MKAKNRKSNIELLRIVSMLLIISFHYVYKSGYTYNIFSINTFIVKIFYFFGELGVNIFFLISGYFMIKGKFSIKKLICILLEAEFYNLFCAILGIKLSIYTLNGLRDYILLLFPTILGQYWFITVYVLVYIFSPYINILISNLSKKEHKKIILLFLLIWSIIPSFFGIFFNSTETLLYYSRFVWFIVMYFVGAYIRIYGIKKLKKSSVKFACISFTLMVLSILFFYKFRNIFLKIGLSEIAYFWSPNNILMFILSISLFQIFLEIEIKSNVVINKLASTTLGIYMLHDGILNTYLWHEVFKNKVHLESRYSIVYILLSTIIIFVIGAVIDIVRQFIEKNTIKKFFDSKLYNKISNQFKQFFK